MQTSISDYFLSTGQGQEANDILRKCVHCGFCTATCPTYQALGDELDSPRGRIYLVKQVLEGNEVTAKTQTHLDRCLTCRSCETTCPSGVEYSHLLDIGRHVVDEQVRRPAAQRLLRKFLARFLTSKRFFNSMLTLGRTVSFLLPTGLQRNLNIQKRLYPWPTTRHGRNMLLLDGCVQPGLAPNINLATARVFDRLGISLSMIKQAGCCGAVNWHLSEPDRALLQMKQNIDAWMPAIENGAEAIVITASACAAMVKEYGYYLREDTEYAGRAKQVSALVKDVSEVLAAEDLSPLVLSESGEKIAFHPPCTLQHGQALNGVVESILTKVGFTLAEVENKHLCCGAAGTYSILQKRLSREQLRQKLGALFRQKPDIIATANIGCLLHLQSESTIEVKHWIELLDP